MVKHSEPLDPSALAVQPGAVPVERWLDIVNHGSEADVKNTLLFAASKIVFEKKRLLELFQGRIRVRALVGQCWRGVRCATLPSRLVCLGVALALLLPRHVCMSRSVRQLASPLPHAYAVD